MKPVLHVVAHIEAVAGQEAEVKEVLEGFLAPTRAEKGCLRYDLFQDLEDAKKFTFIEEWESKEDLDAHSRSAHLAAGRARLEGKRAGAWVQLLVEL